MLCGLTWEMSHIGVPGSLLSGVRIPLTFLIECMPPLSGQTGHETMKRAPRRCSFTLLFPFRECHGPLGRLLACLFGFLILLYRPACLCLLCLLCFSSDIVLHLSTTLSLCLERQRSISAFLQILAEAELELHFCMLRAQASNSHRAGLG